MLQRVFKLTTLCMDTRSQSFPPLVSGLIHDALLQSSPHLNKPLLKNDFFDIPSYSKRVRWANLQPSNVKFLQDTVCQKWLKSVHFWRSYSKNKNVRILFGTQCKSTTDRCSSSILTDDVVCLVGVQPSVTLPTKWVYCAIFYNHRPQLKLTTNLYSACHQVVAWRRSQLSRQMEYGEIEMCGGRF